MSNPNPIPHLENLKRIESSEKARELGSRGGKASQEVQRRKRSIAERLEVGLKVVSKLMADQAESEGLKELLEQEGGDIYLVTSMMANKKASPADRLRAVNMMWSRMEGNPPQNVKSENVNYNVDLNNLTEDELDNKIRSIADALGITKGEGKKSTKK